MTSPDNVEYNQYPEYTGFNSGFISGFGNKNQSTKSSIAVSYTHLTLPTIFAV